MYSQFEDMMLLALYQERMHFNDPEFVRFESLIEKYGIEAKPGWLIEAQRGLISQGFITGPRNSNRDEMAIGRITGSGLRVIEEKWGTIEGVGLALSPVVNDETTQPADNEPDALLKQLIPASDRLVTPNHNAPDFSQALAKVEEAHALIGRSNSLSEDEKQSALVNIDAGLSVLRRSGNFAIGAIRYLILDRLKSAFEGAIEDAFKVALTVAFLALATYLIALI